MKRFWLLLMMFFVSACAPVVMPGTDPNVQLAIAQAHLTGTAQAWQIQQAAWTATAQSWTPTASLTPVPTSTPTVTFTPTVNVTGTLMVEQMNAEIAEMTRIAARKDATNRVLAWMPYVVFGLALGLVSLLGYVFARRLAMVPTPIHEGTGKPQPLLNVLDGVVVDVDRMANGAGQVTGAWVRALPAITAERQDAVTQRAQLVDMNSRRAKLPRALVERQSVEGRRAAGGVNPFSAGNEAGLFPLPSWDLVNAWQGDRKLLPYGLTSNGLGYVNVDVFPHWAVIGMTGAGKSRRFIRPLIAFALAAGHRVVIIGKMTDYGVFAAHPNATLVHVNQMTKPEHAEFYGAALLALLGEMEMRDSYLMNKGMSTWAQAGRQNTFVVLDEVQNAIRMMKVSRSANADRVQMGVAGLVSEGRKVGFNVALAAQRATGLADVLSQTGKAIFRVEREEENAHKSLVGASNLGEGYFYARFGDVRLTGAFEPTDEQIRGFLGSRPVQTLDADWVDGTVVESLRAELPVQDAPKIEPPKSDVEKLAEAYLNEWTPGMSGQAIGRMIGKPYGGSWKAKIDDLRAAFERLSGRGLEGAGA